MKTLITLLTLTFFINVSANVPSQICNGEEFCFETKRTGLFKKSKKYFAKGIGIDCREAFENAGIVFVKNFGEIDSCGLFNGPHRFQTCRQLENGDFEQWRQCDTRKVRLKKKSKRQCVNIGGLPFC